MHLFGRKRDAGVEPQGRGNLGTGGAGDSANGEVFTVDEAIESIGIGFFQVLILSVAGLIWVSRARSCVPVRVGLCLLL